MKGMPMNEFLQLPENTLTCFYSKAREHEQNLGALEFGNKSGCERIE